MRPTPSAWPGRAGKSSPRSAVSIWWSIWRGDYVTVRADTFDLAIAERVVAVNFNGALRLADAVLADLQPGGGIAFVASVAGYRGLPKALVMVRARLP